jgi:hypothetical protein
MRRAARQKRSQTVSLTAPTRGKVEINPAAAPDPMSAEALENFLPTQRGLKVRGGISRAAYVTDPVKTLFAYNSTVDRLFAATADAVYDITALNATTVPAPVISDMASGDWSVQQIGLSGGDYLVAVNGADLAHVYDDTAWHPLTDEAVNDLDYDALTSDFVIGETVTGGTSGANAEILGIARTTSTSGTLKVGAVTSGPFQDGETITSASGSAEADGANSAASSLTLSGSGLTTDELEHVWLYRSRMFFVERDSLRAWYTDASALGAMSDINLSGVFRKGGSLLFGATWSLDSGDGLDDKCVFVTTEGELAVYSGNDPSSSTDWALEGRYDIGKPLAKRAVMRAGGDVLIATDDGIVPVSQVVQKDPAALSLAAVSRPIEQTWAEEARRHNGGAELLKWTSEYIGLVILPDADRMLTVNLQTGAWAEQSGWFGNCAGEFLGDVYIGRENGRVYKLNDTGLDDGATFVARVCFAFNDGGNPASYKVTNLARAAWFAEGKFAYRIGIATDYSVAFPSAPSAVDSGATTTGMIWGTSNWGDEVWGGAVGQPAAGLQSNWQSVSGAGFSMAPTVQVTSGSDAKLNVELLRVDVNVEMGGVAS